LPRGIRFWGIVVVAVLAGIVLRQWLYPASAAYRFPPDVETAWYQGSKVYANAASIQQDKTPPGLLSVWRGYLELYDQERAQAPDGQYDLDYPPGRLLIMSLWVWHEMPGVNPAVSKPADLAQPLLWIDTVAELSGAVLAFRIVQTVLGRAGAANAAWPALLAALLLWFNPAVLLDRITPQWDSWVLPFYLGAALLALKRRWLACGLCLGLGMMFKGQILATMAIFVLWPLFQARWRESLYVVAGVFAGAMLCTAPWLVRTLPAAIMLAVLLVLAAKGRRFVEPTWRLVVACAAFAVAVFLAGLLFGGSFAWWFVPFVHGAGRYLGLGIGTPNNLGVLLALRWEWDIQDVVFTIDWLGLAITMRQLLIGLYAVSLAICAAGLARNDLRNDRHTLIALAAPWVCMFAFMPQMHGRYLYWGAAITALAAGVSLGTTLLHLAVSLMACIAMGTWLTRDNQWPELTRLLSGAYPDSGWAVILLALILLYLSVIPSRRHVPGRSESAGEAHAA
jgi:hypothetical protein